jgi:hypothetical protein
LGRLLLGVFDLSSGDYLRLNFEILVEFW